MNVATSRARAALPQPWWNSIRSRLHTSSMVRAASSTPHVQLPPLFNLNTPTDAASGAAPTPRAGDTAILAMSGGVDSSVAALISIQAGLLPKPLFMRNWNDLEEGEDFEPGAGGGAQGCGWVKDWEGVQETCEAMGMGREAASLLDLSKDYWLSVFQPALEAWQQGDTPNPDVGCNREIKFGALMDRVMPPITSKASDTAFGRRQEKTWLVTGHYARVAWELDAESGRWEARLARARDRTKDQSYFLSSVPSSRLAHAHFPLADLLKAEVRDIARAHKLPAAEKDESMGLCFVGKPAGTSSLSGPVPAPKTEKALISGGAFGHFLGAYLTPKPGRIIAPDGTKVGTHAGLYSLTVGQRARIAGAKVPWYVARKNSQVNEVYVVPGGDHPALFARSMRLRNIAWSTRPRHGPLRAQIRHGTPDAACQVVALSNSSVTEVTFDRPEGSVAPGQVCALYEGDVCVGSGVIESVRTLEDEPDA